MSDAKRVVIPCSGIGKAFGTVAREATYQLTETGHQEDYRTICLPLLVAGDPKAINLLKQSRVYTIDGCPKKCATLCVERTGMDVAMEVMVPKILAKNTDHKPGSVLDIGSNGVLLAKDIVNAILEEESDRDE